MTGMFTKATKQQLKGRLALAGPTGSGKTWTALEWAAVLGKRVALIDTERGSAQLYSHRFDFDVLTMQPPFEPERLVAALNAAEAEGYDVVIVDSLSHFWEGEGGVLDIVDGAAQRAHGNSFAGWKVGTPALRHLVDTLLGLDAHLVVTMRSKMEYILEMDSKGRQVPKKVGMAPVMRAGVEYEFTLIGDLDLEHRIVISKSRCDELADAVVAPGRAAEAAETFKRWLDSGEPMASRNDIDALKEAMDRFPDETRKAWKTVFVDRFGSPDRLTAAQITSAREWVAAREGGTDDSPDTEGGEQGTSAEGSQQDVTSRGGRVTAPAPNPGDDDSRRRRVNGGMSRAGVRDDDERHALIRYATGGAAESSAGLTGEQVAQVITVCQQYADGFVVFRHTLDGAVELVAAESVDQ